MPIAYQKDIKLYITIEALEGIKHLFKNVKGIKSRLHKLLMSDKGNHFLFDTNEYTLIKVKEKKQKEKDKENDDTDEKKSETKEIDKWEQKNKKENKKEDTDKDKQKDKNKNKYKGKDKNKDKNKGKQKGETNEKKQPIVDQENEEEEEYEEEENVKMSGNKTTLLQPSDVTVEAETDQEKKGKVKEKGKGKGEKEKEESITREEEEEEEEREEVDDEKTKEEKRKKHETIFNDKCIEDEYDFVSEEIFKTFFPEENIKFGKKYKILIEIIMQTIIYADKIKLNIYKLNLFISIIIMTLHQIMKNLGKKKRKKKVIKYFMELLDKNTNYGTSENEQINENVDIQNMDTEQSTKIPTENIQQPLHMNDQESELKSKSTFQKETVVTVDDSKESEKMEKEKKGKTDMNKLGLEQEQNQEPIQEQTEFILFDYREAKYIIKYMFENIFSIYNIYEYMFLFSPVPINLTFTNSSSFATPTESFTLNDKLEFDEAIPDSDKNATNSYIKEMLDVPMFVLDKFYDHIEDLREKIDDIVKIS